VHLICFIIRIQLISKSYNCQPIINITIDELLLLLLLLVVVLVLLPVVQPQTQYFSVHSLITIQISLLLVPFTSV